jgi:hypothetical protein
MAILGGKMMIFFKTSGFLAGGVKKWEDPSHAEPIVWWVEQTPPPTVGASLLLKLLLSLRMPRN